MKKQTGLTLIELMVTTVILALIMTVAVPSMKSFLDRGNLSVVAPIFERSIKYARSEAIQRSQTIRLSPVSGSRDWSQGWRIDLVTGPNPADVQLIREFDPLPGSTVFTSDTFDSNTVFDILPNGQASALGNFSLNREDCITGARERLVYNVLLSGNLNRTMTTCP